MDIANQLFSLTLGVEPNKQTLQTLAQTLNSAGMNTSLFINHVHGAPLVCFYRRIPWANYVVNNPVFSLSEKQKALSQYADTAEAQKFVSQAPIPQQQQLPPQLSQQQIQYIQAAPTPQAAKARKAKILRDPVVWQITEKQLKELQWKRKQLLQAQKADLERKRKARANRPPPPKLGTSKARLRLQAEEERRMKEEEEEEVKRKQQQQQQQQATDEAEEMKSKTKNQDTAKVVQGQSKNGTPSKPNAAAKAKPSPPSSQQQKKPAAAQQKAPATSSAKAPTKGPAKGPAKPPPAKK